MATRRRNGLALRRNGALNKMVAKKIGTSVSTAAGRKKVQDYKRTAAYKKWAASAATKKRLTAARKAEKAKTAKKRAHKAKTGMSKAAQFYASVSGRKTKSKSKGRKSKKGLNAWQQYVSDHSGRGIPMDQLADMARKEGVIGGTAKKAAPKKRRSTAKKKAATRSTRRAASTMKGKKTTGTMSSGRKWYRVGNKFVSAAAYKKAKANPSRKRRNPTRRRRNGGYGGLALRKNQGLPFVDTAASIVDKVPVIGGPLAEFVPTLAVAGVSGLGVLYLHKFMEEKDYVPVWAEPYSYTLVGLGGAMATLAIPVGNLSTRRTLAAGMAMVGVFGDLITHFNKPAAVDMAMMEGEMGALAFKANRGYGALAYKGGALNNPGYGAYEYTGGALNNPGYGALAYKQNPTFRGPAHPEIHYGQADVNGAYMNAENGDAAYAPGDFDMQEAQVLMMGPQAFFQKFGKPAHSMYNRSKGGASTHAGKHGHRWGWMIKLVGFKGMQQLASMPTQARRQMIAQLKTQAQQSLMAHSGNILPTAPDVYAASGADGAHGYGALMFKGGAL